MTFFQIVLTAIALSMDAFAAALCQGLQLKKPRPAQAVFVGLFFGGFQALMPIIGWALGLQFEHLITAIDHWLAFGILVLIGGHMIYEVLQGSDCPVLPQQQLQTKTLIMLALATSIDALAVGVTFAFLHVDIWCSSLMIGVITFLISALGVLIGSKVGDRLHDKAQVAGGVVLIFIGLKILLEHTGIL